MLTENDLAKKIDYSPLRIRKQDIVALSIGSNDLWSGASDLCVGSDGGEGSEGLSSSSTLNQSHTDSDQAGGSGDSGPV